jgi:hypothetical protein
MISSMSKPPTVMEYGGNVGNIPYILNLSAG